MWKLFIANLKMTIRDKQAIFWSLAFPLMFIIIFGLFDFEAIGDAKYVIIDNAQSELSTQAIDGFAQIDFLKREDFSGSLDTAKTQLQNGDIDFILVIPENFSLNTEPAAIDPGATPDTFQAPQIDPLQVYYDENNLLSNQVALGVINTFVDHMNLQLTGAQPILSYTTESVQAKDIRYIDLIMPGILGMAIMTSAVIGISTGISRYREQQLLKRLSATPIKVRTFLMAEVLSYLALTLVQVSLIMLLARIAFGVQVYGSYLLIYLLAIFGSIIFLNLGFAVAGYSKNTKTAEALSQVVTMPMMFFSGVFFPVETLPKAVASVVQFLPLTPMIEALRKISIDAQGIDAMWSQLGLMAGWIVISFLIAWKSFKFKDAEV